MNLPRDVGLKAGSLGADWALSGVYDETVDRAGALVPGLAAAAAATEDAGRILPAHVREIEAAGLWRIVQPRSAGGLELAPTIFFDVGSRLGRGCASTSWVVGNLASHQILLAHWPERAQQEIWGVSQSALIGSSYVFTAGRAQRVDGGYLLSGCWPYSSGIDPCEWVQLGAMVPGEDGQPAGRRYFQLPRADYEILETWDVAGLRGTGSKDVRVVEVFVPEYRTVSYDDVVQLRSPGLALHPQALFRFPFWAAGGYVLLSTLYGASSAALEQFVGHARSAVAKSSGQGVAGHATLQQRIGRAAALLDTVELTARRRLGDLHTMLEHHGRVDPPYAARARRDASYLATLCVEAVDLLFAASGGGALQRDNPMQRIWRDVHAGAANFTLQWDVAGPAYGRVLLGLPSGLPGMPV
jgi:3-hydroxy-9,10-secoandrosta-1,3,5(10)-triene-9,17-dione monooxygenase